MTSLACHPISFISGDSTCVSDRSEGQKSTKGLLTSILDRIAPVNPVAKRRRIRMVSYAAESAAGLEVRLKEKSAANVIKHCDLTTREGRWNQLIQEVFESMVPHCERQDITFDVVLIKKKEVNAYAQLGGLVSITTGLLENLEKFTRSDAAFRDGVAFVLGHELTHINASHALTKQMARTAAKVSLIGLAAIALAVCIVGITTAAPVITWLSAAFLLGMAVHLIFHEKLMESIFFSKRCQQFEIECDLHSLNYMTKAGYGKSGIEPFFNTLAAASANCTHSRFSTHPPPAKRLELALQRAAVVEMAE